MGSNMVVTLGKVAIQHYISNANDEHGDSNLLCMFEIEK